MVLVSCTWYTHGYIVAGVYVAKQFTLSHNNVHLLHVLPSITVYTKAIFYVYSATHICNAGGLSNLTNVSIVYTVCISDVQRDKL